MAKFSSKEKIQAVKRYLDGTESGKIIAKSVGVNPSVLREWIRRYESSGEKAFEKCYTFYPAQYKLDVLYYMNEHGTSIRETAALFNIPSYETLRKWKIAYETGGLDALQLKKKGRPTMKDKKIKPVDEGSIEALQAENERLRMENAYFKKVECLSSKQRKITKQDKAQVIYELRHEFPIKELLQLANIPRSTYYYWMKRFNRPDPNAEVKELIQAIYNEHDGCYGYRRIRDELMNRGHKVNHKKVYRLMKELGLKCLVRMKKYRSYKGTVGKIAPNILNRNFQAEKPNEKWVTDITEFKLFGEKLYLSPMLDLFNGEIITYTIGPRPTYSLVSTMLDQALYCVTDPDKLLIHSDQGWHYQMKQYRHSLKNCGITQSMSRKGNCYDNAVIENFFGIMKSEFLYRKEFENITHFKQELAKYIEYYNHKRIKAKLKGMSPVQYRAHILEAA
ncbi:TPA: IS3-like element ISBth10 family transposase [Bacillus paranthracis]|nr:MULTISPECIES: IS3-like element ISBth10 family transposase [Bacillus cereus group]MCY9253282.1 IS3 family transposase [Bacillus paranthracis]MDA1499992.1 IS3-like element ISBth10 family transposase [Bacillus cereus group sp. TH41-1LC]MDA1686192.1 IS3-like element ISBth10 family transposase [Bacillus cereus group sp. m2-21]MDA1696649.1 IS3-like element ISBth10 family transposase [Bacillus cereus group sp. m1-2]MDA1701736.1 IS3-like element ISBth10 family transposase [Bacillus cereus group sp.